MDTLPPLREVMKLCNIIPSKALGQNFIFDLNLTGRIARSAGDLSNFTILEIGAGPGGLTRALLAAGAKQVVAIERDQRCIKALEMIEACYPGRLRIINADALSVKEEEIIEGKCKIVANLPYNISTPLLFKWLDKAELFTSMTLMFQKEVAERIVAKPGSKAYGRLSVMAQFCCEVEMEFNISPQAFFPPPKITSSVVCLIPRLKLPAEISKVVLGTVCAALFNQRRKMLKSSLKQLTPDPITILHNAGIDPEKRPEDLSVEEFCRLARQLT